MSKIVRKVPVEVQNRSGFNVSHSNSFTAHCGTLMPILVDHIMPNTTIHLDAMCEVNLPPSVSDFYGTIEARMEFFFVPYRVIWAGWKYFFTQPPQGGNTLIPSNPTNLQITKLPNAQLDYQNQKKLSAVGGLGDMLGFKDIEISSTIPFELPNILPFVAYQKIYDDFYRDSRITQPLFYPPQARAVSDSWKHLPFVLNNTDESKVGSVTGLFDLHQRCWDKDYFTNATTQPQAGDASILEFEIDTNAGIGSFSISSLRTANSLQRFAEVNNLAGQRMADQQYARFGCYPSDAALDKPLYLGQKRFSIYKRSVYQQSAEFGADEVINPFTGKLGNKVSALSGRGEGFLGKFHAKDSGLIFVMFSLVPQAVYSTGTRRYLSYSKLSDFPEPLLQSVGDQPIYSFELGKANTLDKTKIFGYTQRFAEAKFMNDEVHGLLRDGQNLECFQLQRSFGPTDSLGSLLNTAFLEIPQNYLDQVTTSSTAVSEFGCWCNAYFNYKKVEPLAGYSLATLGEPKDTHTVIIDAGGKRL